VGRVPALNTVRILWGALLFSTVLFLVLLLVIKPEPPEPPEPLMLPVLAVAALGSIVAREVIPRMNYRQVAARVKLETTEEPVADSARAASDVLPFRETTTVLRKVAKNPQAARQRALVIYQTVFILKMALAESVALYGFVLHFLGFPLLHALPFFGVCWVLMLTTFPTLEKAIAPLEQATGVHIPRA
jgi:hypothetical protein